MCWTSDRDLYLRLNKELVSMEPVTEKHDIAELRGLIQAHAGGHRLPARPRRSWPISRTICPYFKKILPHDYDRMLRTIAQYEEQGMSREQAQVEAFYANTERRGASNGKAHRIFGISSARGTPPRRPWSASGIVTSSTPGWAGRSGGARAPGAWSAACPSASPARC